MKKYISIIVIMILLLSGCTADGPTSAYDGPIDYDDATSFEQALNNSEDVNGKTVRFCVVDYAPHSILGINIHAGEHLNFILENEIIVEPGDFVIVRISEAPSKVFLTDSWKIPCEVLSIEPTNEPESSSSVTAEPSKPATSSPIINIIPSQPPATDLYYIFGHYEQDGNSGNGAEPIQWIILEETDDSLLLISRYILDYQEFNDTVIANATSWRNSTLRKWLNNDFYKEAFSSSERDRILSTQVQDYKADGVRGDVTKDYVFILSKSQAFTYFTSNRDRATISTAFANTREKYPTDAYWLIDSYSSDLYKYLINSDGRNENYPRVNESEGVRPVIWVKK